MDITSSPELFINMRRIPDQKSEEYDAFFQAELEKIRYGVTINGVYLHGWLYWHLCHWNIFIDEKDPNNPADIIRVFKHPELRDNEWIINHYLPLAEEQKKGLMIFGSRRLGKELLNCSTLYLADGEKPIGTAQVGDRIYGADGKLTTITGVFPQGRVPIYRMTLRDGRVLHCGLKHNWYVFDRQVGKYVVKTTEQLLDSYQRPRIHNGYKDGQTRTVTEHRYFIPTTQPVQYDEKELPVDPYLLGLWLGDGNSGNLGFTSVDQPIIDYLYRTAANHGLVVKIDCADTYLLTTGSRGGRTDKNGLWNKFKALNLPKNKHIPEEYRYASIDQRLALLQGLMDTDGTSSNGTISFSTKSAHFAESVMNLCRSLGIVVRLKNKPASYTKNGVRVSCGTTWELRLYTELPVFRLERKLANIRTGNKGHQPKINKTAIIGLEYVFDGEATCIMVDNEDHLFLTDGYTVTHNSEFEASWLARGATIYQGSENVLAGLNEGDIKVVASKIDKGLNSVHPYFQLGRLQDDWRKEVSLGFKEKRVGGKRIEWSKIWIRNLDEGKNTEAIAGTTPKTLIIDEVGKGPFMEAFEAAKPGFTSPFGWRCVPILTGTGGMFEPNSDAEKVFKSPEAHNFLAIEIPGKAKKYGVFIPGTYRMEAKVKTTFGDYLRRTSGILVPEGSELDGLEFYEKDDAVAKRLIHDEITQLQKSHDPKAALKARMYYPEDPDDCFLSAEVNQFPLEAIEEHLKWLDDLEKRQGFVGQAVELYRKADGTVGWTTHTKLKEIRDFPVKADTVKDAPVMLYEPPVEHPAPYMYIAGSDPYNQNTSDASPSLGTVYIYKRLYDPVAGTWQNMAVASYAGRPQQMKDWHKIVEMLLELYSATCMIENAGTNFIEYLDTKNKGYLLADGYNLLQQISPNTGIKNRPKGLPPTPRVINHCMGLLYDYCTEELTATDEAGNPITKLGVTRIFDRMLLTEMKNYSSDGNFDRIVAFRHALVYDAYLQKIAPVVRYQENPEPPKTHKPLPRSPFIGLKGSPFSTFGKSPF